MFSLLGFQTDKFVQVMKIPIQGNPICVQISEHLWKIRVHFFFSIKYLLHPLGCVSIAAILGSCMVAAVIMNSADDLCGNRSPQQEYQNK